MCFWAVLQKQCQVHPRPLPPTECQRPPHRPTRSPIPATTDRPSFAPIRRRAAIRRSAAIRRTAAGTQPHAPPLPPPAPPPPALFFQRRSRRLHTATAESERTPAESRRATARRQAQYCGRKQAHSGRTQARSRRSRTSAGCRLRPVACSDLGGSNTEAVQLSG